jgi:antitoxin PrlF
VSIIRVLLLLKRKEYVESALSVKGQATIPKAIRKHLHLEPGDQIKFFIHPDGSVVILPKLRTSTLKGMVRPKEQRVSLDDMESAAAEGTADSRRRTKRR